MYRIVYGIFALLCAISVQANERVILFGGGPMPDDSQVSIEKNTQWILSFLQQRYEESDIAFYYTDGEGIKPDVRVPRSEPVSAGDEMLSRIFRLESELGIGYRQNVFSAEQGSAAAPELVSAFKSQFRKANANDSLFLIYQGHGGYRPADTNNNYFRLWGGTELTVDEMASLMSLADDGATIRFVFPQCFSGAFSKVIYRNAEPEQGLASNTRCGFLAQPDYLESEGCTDSVNTGDYRDYSSYFFSALSGTTIDGQKVAGLADQNGDGEVSLREAHFYTLETARSIDFSRATSEDYLEHWQPWYVKWAPSPGQINNEYEQLAQRMIAALGYEGDWSELSRQIWSDIRELEQQVSSARQELEALKKKIRKAQNRAQLNLLLEWPYLKNPYSDIYRQHIEADLPVMVARYGQHPDYERILELQHDYDALEGSELDLRRNLVQLRKIIRFKKLATIKAQFQRFAGEQEQQEYERLVSCEDSVL